MESAVCTLRTMSDQFYDPNQNWNPMYWGYNEPPQHTPSSGPDMNPVFCAPPPEASLLQSQLPYTVPTIPYTNHVPQYGPTADTAYQQRWRQASLTQMRRAQTPQLHLGAQSHGYPIPSYPTPGPSRAAPSPSYLSAVPTPVPSLSRNDSGQSHGNSQGDHAPSEVSRSVSPNPSAIAEYGYKGPDGRWACAWPGCTSRSRFTRACDLRKHYKRHSKTLFCRQEGCPQATEGGFSSKKDRARHEAKHNPMITCEWDGCGRLFSRVDNMKDHVRRVHERRAAGG
ncbi:hypothetical protein WHR41_04383 [Cladosporium halotolerans]|uniref:C2H2-type domain-containing protein n=1 Tax=Cladosporium halotolerans TaxID=1052096 RepID=A0AB34KQ73_9PEZI